MIPRSCLLRVTAWLCLGAVLGCGTSEPPQPVQTPAVDSSQPQVADASIDGKRDSGKPPSQTESADGKKPPRNDASEKAPAPAADSPDGAQEKRPREQPGGTQDGPAAPPQPPQKPQQEPPARQPEPRPDGSGKQRGLPPPPEARRSPPRRGSDGVWEITFDTLKFPIEKDQPFRRELLTTQIWDLVGKKVRIRGYMLPTFKQTGLTEFVLVRDNMECCFGPGAALYDCTMVYMVPGKTADFSIRPVTVTGTFTIEEFRDFEDVVRAVFRIDAVEVRQ